ncbi:MAG: MaoC family dehydratase [Actinomycetota bacterium]|nr:MaoC family dehydratase [Actinomycetota bacterium]
MDSTVRRNLGLFFEDFTVGDIFRHPLGRTILDADNTWFTLLTLNTNELHFNNEVAAASEHGRPIVNSGFTVALILGMSVSDISQNALANLGWNEIRLSAPVFVGDTLYAESIVTAVRDSRSRPDAGILSCFTRGVNQDGVEVLSYRRSVLVLKRDAGQAHRRFPEPEVLITTRVDLHQDSS